MLHNPPGIEANKGIILGHECVGEVVETGASVKTLKTGDRIILDNNLPCGVCPACQSGSSNLCVKMASMGVHIDGVFAQYAVAPEEQMAALDDTVFLDVARQELCQNDITAKGITIYANYIGNYTLGNVAGLLKSKRCRKDYRKINPAFQDIPLRINLHPDRYFLSVPALVHLDQCNRIRSNLQTSHNRDYA
ncbi:alcohol dehydrogenase catalytic domain-containing protein [Lachnospiraceae bacterium 54-53]